MSASTNAEPELAGEDATSSSEGLRPDTRTSNSEEWEGRLGRFGAAFQPESAPHQAHIPGLQQKINQLQELTAQPERREASRARKKLMKDVQHEVHETGKTDAEKISYLLKMLGDEMTRQNKVDKQLIPMKKSCDTASKERDAAVEEKARIVELNNKLHELCRELRKENALLLDTSKAISAQELDQRKTLTDSFQGTVDGITKRLEQHERERGRVEVENDNLKQKLRALCEQYEARDSHYHQQLQTKELELKMATMKLQDHAALLKQADIHQRQLSESLDQASRSKEDTDKMLASYNDRFAECQSSIEKSNEVFQMLRKDSEQKAQLLKQAERDKRTMLKRQQDIQLRITQTNARLVQLTDENNTLKQTSNESEKARLRVQNEKLQGLCRHLRQQVKDLTQGTEHASSAADDAPEPSEASDQEKNGKHEHCLTSPAIVDVDSRTPSLAKNETAVSEGAPVS